MSKNILKERNWLEFNLSDIVKIKSGVTVVERDRVEGTIPYVSSSGLNNGIIDFVSNENRSLSRNVLAVNFNGTVGENFYHPYYAIFSTDVRIFEFKEKSARNKYCYLFLKQSILKQVGKYGYGYKFNSKRMMKQKILLPVTTESKPDYTFMEQYIKEIFKNHYKTTIDFLKSKDVQYLEIEKLENKEWVPYKLEDVFDKITRGRRLTKNNQIEGTMPYISSKGINNGVDNFIGNDKGVRNFNKCLTIANSGTVGSTFYHDYSFVASDHVTALELKENNKYAYLFIATILKRIATNYSFNREINNERILKEKIILPINDLGDIDFIYMEQYMKNKEIDKTKKLLSYYEEKLINL